MILKWNQIRTIGNSELAKITIFIPLFGYLFLFNENISQYLDVAGGLLAPGTHENLDKSEINRPTVSWRLLLSYLGFCLIAGGSILYGVFCPLVIKMHGSSVDYIRSDLEYFTHSMYQDVEATIVRRGGEFELSKLKVPTVHWADALVSNNTRNEILALHYSLENKSFPVARFVAASLYIGGVVVLSIPSIFVLYRVLVSLYNLL